MPLINGESKRSVCALDDVDKVEKEEVREGGKTLRLCLAPATVSALDLCRFMFTLFGLCSFQEGEAEAEVETVSGISASSATSSAVWLVPNCCSKDICC
jgi:hypothetical protein